MAMMFILASPAQALVSLPNLFTDHMVLQRGVSVHVWGTADPSEAVTVSFAGNTASGVSDGTGAWSLYLPPLAASATGRALTLRGPSNSIVRNDVVAPVGGHHLLPFAPLFLTYFFFILAMNLSGLVPVLFKGPTANLWINMTLAASVIVFLFGAGMVKQGPVGFLKNIVPSGIPWWLWPFMFLLEFAGTILRCSVLGIRLFANMVAGHLAIPSILALGIFKGGAVTGMAVAGLIIGIPLALGMTLLEVLVALIQAYVFTMLAVIFSGAAVHPEH